MPPSGIILLKENKYKSNTLKQTLRCPAWNKLNFKITLHYLTWYRITLTGMINILKPTGHVMHRHLNIQQLYPLATMYLSVLYSSENKQRVVLLRA